MIHFFTFLEIFLRKIIALPATGNFLFHAAGSHLAGLTLRLYLASRTFACFVSFTVGAKQAASR